MTTSTSLHRFLSIGLVAIAVVGIGSGLIYRVSSGSDFQWTLWIDRDLYRAFFLGETFQVLGPELQQGGRIPGAFFYYLLYAFQQIDPTPPFIYGAAAAMEIAAMGLFALTVYRLGGIEQALLASCLFALTIVRGETYQILWNPSFVPLFAVLVFLLCAKLLYDGKAWALPSAVFIASLASQIHLSFAYLLILIITLGVISRRHIAARYWLLALFALLLPLFPFIAHEALTGFTSTDQFFVENEAHRNRHNESGFWMQLLGGANSILTATTSGQFYYLDDAFQLLSDPISNFRRIGAIFKPLGLGVAFLVVSSIFLLKAETYFLPNYRYHNYLNDRRLIVTFWISIILAIFIHAIISDDFRIRYTLWLIPFSCYLTALFILYLKKYLIERLSPTIGWFSAIVLLTVFGGFVHTYAQTLKIESGKPIKVTYADVKEVFEVATVDFGFPRNGLTFRIAGFAKSDSGEWVRVFANGNAYLEVVWPTGKHGTDVNSCLAALNRRSINGNATRQDFAAALGKYGMPSSSFRVLNVLHRSQFSYFRYQMRNGNCPHSFTDGYILTSEEQEIEAAANFSGSRRKLEVELPGTEKSVIVNLHPTYEVKLRFDVLTDQAGTYVRVVGNDLRRYDTFGMSALYNSRFVFESLDDGRRKVATLFGGKLGNGFDNVVLAPWRSDSVRLEAGRYSVSLEVDNFEPMGRAMGALRFDLFDEISIR